MGLLQKLGIAVVSALPPYNQSLFRFCRRYVDRYRGNAILGHGVGEELVLAKVAPFCSVCFDVGANQGDWTATLLAANPAVEVHCFEPAGAWPRLRDRDLGPRVVKNNLAVGDAPGELTLHVGSVDTYCSVYDDPSNTPVAADRGTVRVGVTTIDDYCRERQIDRIDFVKIDVEGHELAVLRGAAGMLSRRAIRCVQFERSWWAIPARVFLKDIMEFVNGHGYALFKIYRKGIRPIEKYSHHLDDFQYSNYLAVADPDILRAVPRDGPRTLL